jgi:hypothetical protein
VVDRAASRETASPNARRMGNTIRFIGGNYTKGGFSRSEAQLRIFLIIK